MTTKKKFEVNNPEVVVLKNGRYAFRAECPWTGKNEKVLVAYKFCSAENYRAYQAQSEHVSKSEHTSETEHVTDDEES